MEDLSAAIYGNYINRASYGNSSEHKLQNSENLSKDADKKYVGRSTLDHHDSRLSEIRDIRVSRLHLAVVSVLGRVRSGQSGLEYSSCSDTSGNSFSQTFAAVAV